MSASESQASISTSSHPIWCDGIHVRFGKNAVLRGATLPADVVLMGMVLTVITFPAIAWALLHSQRWLVGSAQPSCSPSRIHSRS